MGIVAAVALTARTVNAQTYNQNYEDLRVVQANYAVAHGVSPAHSSSLVITGSQAIEAIEYAKGTTLWSSTNGAKLYQHLSLPNAKAIRVSITGAPDYIHIPEAYLYSLPWQVRPTHIFPDAVIDLGQATCNDVVVRIGHKPGNWCVCLIGCPPNECEECSNSDMEPWSEAYPNDALLFGNAAVGTTLPLWFP